MASIFDAVDGKVYINSYTINTGNSQTITPWSTDDFVREFNVNSASNVNKCYVNYVNGDYGAQAHRILATYCKSNTWSFYLDSKAASGSFRICFIVCVPTAYSTI